jgi:hypothetical protein
MRKLALVVLGTVVLFLTLAAARGLGYNLLDKTVWIVCAVISFVLTLVLFIGIIILRAIRVSKKTSSSD